MGSIFHLWLYTRVAMSKVRPFWPKVILLPWLRQKAGLGHEGAGTLDCSAT